MDEWIPGLSCKLDLDNEVFDEDEKSSLGDSWMNEIPGLIWTMKF